MGEIEYAAAANGGQVAYREIGGEGEPIVYASGSMVPIEVMLDDPLHARFLEGLAEFGHLYVFDRRGIGASDPPDWDAPLIAQWVDDLTTVLDAIGAERATLVGHETGGINQNRYGKEYSVKLLGDCIVMALPDHADLLREP